MKTGNILINGKLTSARSGNTFPVRNPATMKEIGVAPLAKEEDINDAVESSKIAFQKWSELPVRERGLISKKKKKKKIVKIKKLIKIKKKIGELVTQIGNAIKNHVEELAQITRF